VPFRASLHLLNPGHTSLELLLSDQYILKPEPVFLNISDVNETDPATALMLWYLLLLMIRYRVWIILEGNE
jgi:hypothetical protein